MAEMGHVFLARLGKTKLRPGGIEATDWLIAQGKITAEMHVLEVACNRGQTALKLVKKFGCRVTGLDMDSGVLEQARAAASRAGLSDRMTFTEGNALQLPFADGSFDIVINEAMLTMMTGEKKAACVREYFRVLKKGGLLLTHDVLFTDAAAAETEALRRGISSAINATVEPLDAASWKAVFEQNGFSVVQKTGAMTLMNVPGMIKDEGLLRTMKIIRNGMKRENRAQFKKMASFFKTNHKKLGYVAHCATKIGE